MPTLTIRPTGVGNASNLQAVGDAPGHNCVDDVTPDDNTTFVRPTAGTQQDTYQMADHTTEDGVISNVRIYIRAVKVTDSSETARIVLRTNSTNYYTSATIVFITFQDSYIDYTENPNTSLDWSWTDIDNLEAGTELKFVATQGPRCTQVWVEVTWTPAETEVTEDREGLVNIKQNPKMVLRPERAGSRTELTPYGDTPGWRCVDDVSPDDDTTYVAMTTEWADYDLYIIPNRNEEVGDISNVRIHARATKTLSGVGAKAQILLKVFNDDRTYWKIFNTDIGISFGWNDFYVDYTLDPITEAAWQWEQINHIQIGISLSYPSGGSPRCTQM